MTEKEKYMIQDIETSIADYKGEFLLHTAKSRFLNYDLETKRNLINKGFVTICGKRKNQVISRKFHRLLDV